MLEVSIFFINVLFNVKIGVYYPVMFRGFLTAAVLAHVILGSLCAVPSAFASDDMQTMTGQHHAEVVTTSEHCDDCDSLQSVQMATEEHAPSCADHCLSAARRATTAVLFSVPSESVSITLSPLALPAVSYFASAGIVFIASPPDTIRLRTIVLRL